MMPLFKILVFWAASTLVVTSVWAQGDYQKGVSFFKQRQYQKAIDEFEVIVKEHPDYEFGHRILGFSYLHLKRYQRSISEFRHALRLKDDVFATYLGLSRAYFNSKRFREVIPTLNKAVSYAKAPGQRYELLRTRGIAAFNVAQYETAVADLQEAIQIRRGEAKDLLQLGLAYYHLKDFEKSRESLTQVLAIDPASSQANRFLSLIEYAKGVSLIESREYVEAARVIAAHTEKNPSDAEAWFNLGLAYLFSEKLTEAEEAFLQDTRLRPDKGDSFARLGYLYEKKKAYRESLSAYEKAAALGHPEAQSGAERIRKRLSQGTNF